MNQRQTPAERIESDARFVEGPAYPESVRLEATGAHRERVHTQALSCHASLKSLGSSPGFLEGFAWGHAQGTQDALSHVIGDFEGLRGSLGASEVVALLQGVKKRLASRAGR